MVRHSANEAWELPRTKRIGALFFRRSGSKTANYEADCTTIELLGEPDEIDHSQEQEECHTDDAMGSEFGADSDQFYARVTLVSLRPLRERVRAERRVRSGTPASVSEEKAEAGPRLIGRSRIRSADEFVEGIDVLF